MRLNECQIANPLIETLSQVILDAFVSCGRITAYSEVTPKWVLSGSATIRPEFENRPLTGSMSHWPCWRQLRTEAAIAAALFIHWECGDGP